MTYINISTLDQLDQTDFISLLKRFAKHAKSASEASHQLAWYQDNIACAFGYLNWSMLHKKIDRMSATEFAELFDKAIEHKQIGPYLVEKTTRTIIEADATQEMKEWARRRFTPLIEFAFYDSESENGFAWPEVDIAYELEEQFGGRFPSEMIRKIGIDLEVDEGPWGLEEYRDDE